jgi:hypothetical protein
MRLVLFAIPRINLFLTTEEGIIKPREKQTNNRRALVILKSQKKMMLYLGSPIYFSTS